MSEYHVLGPKTPSPHREARRAKNTASDPRMYVFFRFSSGNEQMKVENFEAAVHFYGKAIELNPANAVYFCNRCNLEHGGGESCWQGPGRAVGENGRAVGENGKSGRTQGWGGGGSAAILNDTPGRVGSQA